MRVVSDCIYKHPEILEATGEQESRIVENLKIAPLTSWLVTFIPAWCNLYDTNYIIDQKPYLTYEEIPPLPTGTNRRARKVARDLARGAAKRERKLRRLQWLHEHLPHRRRPIEIEDDDTLRDDFLTNAAIEAEQTVRINHPDIKEAGD